MGSVSTDVCRARQDFGLRSARVGMSSRLRNAGAIFSIFVAETQRFRCQV